ncbi:unnamed protein product [Peniophora sp. CBMAI 1063]|nr:unnamed protein product [Peniophora sp. CBMAI 1063]
MPLGLPRLPDLPTYPTLLTAGLAFALYIHFYDRHAAEIRSSAPLSAKQDATPSKLKLVSEVNVGSRQPAPEDVVPAVEKPSLATTEAPSLTPPPSVGPSTPPASPPPSLRPDAPVFRPRSSTRVLATPNVWANSIPVAARDFRAEAEKEYAAGCECKKRAEEANAKASKLIYEANNKSPQPGWIDLHGLYATEAAMYAGMAVDAAQARGEASIKFIVGLGKHSSPDAAKIKPRVLEEMRNRELRADVDPANEGVVVVHLKKKRVRIMSPSGEPVLFA